MKNKKYNIQYYEKIILYDSTRADKFNHRRKILESIGYIIKKIVLTDDGTYKLLGTIKKKPVVNWLLVKKTLPENCSKFAYYNTIPNECEFYNKGVCGCVDHTFCLYQETSNHVDAIKSMVKIYDNYEYKDDKDGARYEDTKLGRIFSSKYDHLNTHDRKGTGFNRNHGM